AATPAAPIVNTATTDATPPLTLSNLMSSPSLSLLLVDGSLLGRGELRLDPVAEVLDRRLERRDVGVDVGLGARHVALVCVLQVLHLLLDALVRGLQLADLGDLGFRALRLGFCLERLEHGLALLNVRANLVRVRLDRRGRRGRMSGCLVFMSSV